MKHLKSNLFWGFILTCIVGTLWHSAYDFTEQNRFIGLIAPINESTFEHMKLVFFPALIYLPVAIAYLKDNYPFIGSNLCCGILAGTLFIPVFYYTYTGILGFHIMAVDIASFYIATAIVYLTTYIMTKNNKNCGYGYMGVLVMLLLFLLFTYKHPALKIFIDPALKK